MATTILKGGAWFSALWLFMAAALLLPPVWLGADSGDAVPAEESSSRREITFAEMDWRVKNGTDMGPGPNHFSDSDESVWVDTEGKLHLKIRQINGVWNCAEVWTLAPAGYGNYVFWLESSVDLYDRNIVAAPFLYADDDQEIDIEFSRWGDPDYDCGSYSVQPYDVPGNNHPFAVDLGGSYSSHSFLWQPDYIHFRSMHGHYTEPPSPSFTIEDWRYTGASIPPESDDMKLHINLWLMSGLPPTDGEEAELIVSNVYVTPGIFIQAPELHIAQINPSQIRLAWNAVPNALSYRVFQADTPLPIGNSGWTTLPSTTQTFLDLDSTSEKMFFYIQAVRE